MPSQCWLTDKFFRARHHYNQTSVLDKDGEMAPGVEPVKVPGDHTDYTEGHPDEFRRLIL